MKSKMNVIPSVSKLPYEQPMIEMLSIEMEGVIASSGTLKDFEDGGELSLLDSNVSADNVYNA